MKMFYQLVNTIEMDDNKKSCLWRRRSRNISFQRGFLALTFVLLVQLQFAAAVTRPQELLESSMEAVASRYCDFSSSDKIYNLTSLLQCMNELAAAAVARTRVGRSSEDYFFPSQKKIQDYSSSSYQYPPKQTNDFQSYYERRPARIYSDSASYQQGQSGYYDGGLKYPYGVEQSHGLSGGVAARLFEALASISQYDDLKCVSRILCEVGTGVIPGNSGYRQNFDGSNSLISLLTNLGIGEPSPLLSFGKSALMGYANRGNPSICYRQYPKCPRSNADLINYLNNHNGGFFRFFGNFRGSGYQGSYYRGVPRQQPALPPGISGPESDRTGTGELKFDSATGPLGREFMKSFFPERREFNNTDKVTFPQEPLQAEQTLNRVSKSLTGFSDPANNFQNPSFFPQDRNDPVSNLLYSLNPSMQVQSERNPQMTVSRKARLYLPEDATNETTSTFTFPDGQKVQINVAFSKLFSESYNKGLRRSFANDHGPEPVNFESFSMINLVELFSNNQASLDLQVVHPCDMVCHDSKGTTVQFSQILLHSKSLSTLMTPDQPVLDLSNTVPCEIICIDRRGEKRQMSTTLNQVLRTDDEPQPALEIPGFQDMWQNQAFRSLNQQKRSKYTETRKVRQNIQQSEQLSQQSQELNIDSVPVLPLKDQTTNSELQLQIGEVGDIDQTDKDVSSVSRDEKRSYLRPYSFNNRRIPSMGRSMPFRGGGMPFRGGPMPFRGRPMPFRGRPMPFMKIPGFRRGPPYLFRPRPFSRFGLGFRRPMAMPMRGRPGGFNSFGMMPMYPGFMPLMQSVAGRPRPLRPVPPKIICSGARCAQQESPRRVLMLCGGKLHFIPRRRLIILPVCAIIVRNGASASSGGPEDTSLSQHQGVTEHQGLGEHQGHGDNQGFGEQQGTLGAHQESGDHQALTEHQGFTEHHGLGEDISSTTSFGSDHESSISQGQGITPPPFGDPMQEQVVGTTHKFRRPEGEDYPQQSCLQGESWNLDTHECVPIKYDPDIELDYTHLPGSPWSGVTRKPSNNLRARKKKKKLVIITDKGNITYIKAT